MTGSPVSTDLEAVLQGQRVACSKKKKSWGQGVCIFNTINLRILILCHISEGHLSSIGGLNNFFF